MPLEVHCLSSLITLQIHRSVESNPQVATCQYRSSAKNPQRTERQCCHALAGCHILRPYAHQIWDKVHSPWFEPHPSINFLHISGLVV